MTILNENIAVTYHRTEKGFIAVLINHSDKPYNLEYKWNGKWEIKKVHYGSAYEINPYDACIFELDEIK